MIPASIIQKILGLLATLWGGGALAVGTSAGVPILSADSIPALLSAAVGALLGAGPSWKQHVNMVRPGTFATAAPAAAEPATPLGDKETEVEMFRCYQELVEAAESENNVTALDHFRDGWVSLFNTTHREKIVSTAKTGATKAASMVADATPKA